MNLIPQEIADILWENVKNYHQHSFVETDPIAIPHRFSQKKDIEISAFFAATLAWGREKPSFQTLISSCKFLKMNLMHSFPMLPKMS